METGASFVLDFTRNKVNHHRSLHENMNKLKRKQEELNSRKEDVKSKIEVELRPGKKLKEEPKLWLANVQIIDVEIRNIENEVKEDETWKRAGLGERVAQKIQEVEELYQKGSFSDGLVVDAPPRKGAILPTTKLAGETTAVRKMEEIWICLISNDYVRKIGVYGMGGSGKTTIMKHINNRFLENDKFNCVIWVTVSKPLNVKKLQNDIASRLQVDISKCEDETIRAAKLFDILREKKKFLLILDDMWDAFHLHVVGIPEPTPDNGCKIMLTTRSLNVCHRMDCKVIKMELLSKKEAWNLFLDNVGRDVLQIRGLKEIAELVAKECTCLPLAVITIAGCMKGVIDIREWRNMLEELKESTNGLQEMRKVFGQLKYSYSRLEDEVHRRCLLYCALYPEDFEINRDKLIELLIIEGIIGEMKSRQAQLNKGHSILNELEKCCLLESGYKVGHVKMHDLIREMALEIMGRGCMVEAGVQLEDLPDDKHWTEDLEWVSLMKSRIMKIRDGASPRCGRLSTLLLSGTYGLLGIADSFFVHMSGLKVLDLSDTDIVMLSNTISDMENLTALLLRGCARLKYVPSLTKLRALKALDLSQTGIEEVPEGMEMLINLKYLNIQGEHLKTFPIRILSNLSRLQYLRVDSYSKTLKLKGDDVASLTKLESFEGTFNDVPDFNIYVRSLKERRLHNYSIWVGPVYSHSERAMKNFDIVKKVGVGRCIIGSRENPVVVPEDCCHQEIQECHDMSSFSDVLSSKHDFLKRCKILKCDSDNIKQVVLSGCIIGGRENPVVVPEDCCHLEIQECHDMSSLSDVLPSKHDLEYCHIQRCDGIECVISSSSSYSCTPFESLEELHLACLQNLRAIYKVGASSPPLPPGTFSCLKHFYMIYCRNMKKLFTPRLLPHLQNLETIHVSVCIGMEEIIGAADDEREGVGESSNRSIDTVEASPSPPLPPGTFSCLKGLFISECPNMKMLFTPRLLPHLQNLEVINVSDCDEMEEIIAAADDEREGEEEGEGGGGVGESSNRSIANTDDSTTSITSRLHLQNQVINVTDCDGMEEIIAAADDEREGEGGGGVGESSNRSIASNDDTTTSITLPKLRELTLSNLPKLKTIVSSRAVMVCESLRYLTIEECPKLKRLPLSLPMVNGQPSSPPSLYGITLGCFGRKLWESLDWDRPTAKDVLQRFIEF